MFLPNYLQKSMADAKVVKDGSITPFVFPVTTLYDAKPVSPGFDPTSPPIVVILFFLIVLGLTYLEYHRNRRFIWLDFVIFLSLGLAGLLLSFLCFFSVLEATGWNLNLVWALPLHLVFCRFVVIPFTSSKT